MPKPFNILNSFVFSVMLFLAIPVQAASPWVKRCEGAACEVTQRLMDKKSETRVLEMAIGFPVKGGDGRGVLILPLGVDLSQGLSMTVDEQTPLGFKVRYCLIDGCYAFLTLPQDVLAAMKKGSMASIDFMTFDGQAAKLPLTLEGFSKSLAEIEK